MSNINKIQHVSISKRRLSAKPTKFTQIQKENQQFYNNNVSKLDNKSDGNVR
jgi:hypothetical protein